MADTVVAEGETLIERLDMEAADSLRVEGTISVSDKNQSVRFAGPTDGATIVNLGVIENLAEEGRAIRFEEDTGARLDATIENDGIIRSADDAIQIDNGDLEAGKVLIQNGVDGEIRSEVGQAIDFGDAGGTFAGRVINHGVIAAATNDGVKLGGVGNVNNSGLIHGGAADGYSGSSDGVSYEDDATGFVINKGRIEGDRHGVDAGEGSDIRVVNRADGVIVGHNGSGVGSDGSATVINYGTITGSFADAEGSDIYGSEVGEEDGGGPDGINDGDGDGVDIDFEAHIENYGVIRGTGAGGTGSDGLPNTAEGVAAGGGVIVNHEGAKIWGAGLGVLIDDSSQGNATFETLIENDGAIVGKAGPAIKIVSDLDDVIVNSGRIVGGDGVAIEFGSGDNTLRIEDGSKIVGLSLGGEGRDTLDFSGFSNGVKVNLTAGEATGTGGVESFEAVLGSDGDDRITGDRFQNVLAGGDGDDRLTGRGGSDTLVGGEGDDAFHFRDANSAFFDVVDDFAVGEDKISLGASFGLDSGELARSAFVVGAEARDASDRIVYDRKSGDLFYDADGKGGEDAVKIAELDAGLKLGHDDIFAV